MVEVCVQFSGQVVEFGAELVGVGCGDVGQQGEDFVFDARDGAVFGAEAVEGVAQVRVVVGEGGEDVVVFAGVVEGQEFAEG